MTEIKAEIKEIKAKKKRYTKQAWISLLKCAARAMPDEHLQLQGSVRDNALRTIGNRKPFDAGGFYPNGFYESFKIKGQRYDLITSMSKPESAAIVMKITPIDWESRIKEVELSDKKIYIK